LGAGQPDRCDGTQVCNANGQCVQCTSNAQCGNGQVCTGNVCVSAGAPNGSECTQNSDCQSNSCRNWSPDGDGDSFGAEGAIVRRCGPPGAGFVGNDDDCCDTDPDARPTQQNFFPTANNCGDFDYDCVNDEEPFSPIGPCERFDKFNCPASNAPDNPNTRNSDPPNGSVSGSLNCGGSYVSNACLLLLRDPISGEPSGGLCFDIGEDCLCSRASGDFQISPQECR
jgi:Cys-rich repeat protein